MTSVDEMALVTNDKDEIEAVEVETEDAMLALCFREAVYTLSAIGDQLLIETAINRLESNDWKHVVSEELMQIEKLGTWELVEAPDNANIIPCRWVLRQK